MKLYANVFGQGKPLLILHGFLGMGDNWKTLGKQYEDLGFQVHLIDQRNHGRSPHSDEFSYELMVNDLYEYITANHFESVNLIGHSMGGKTVMAFACKYPDLINKLIVVDIAPKYYAPHHQEILEGLTAIKNASFKSRSDADDLLSNYINHKGIRQFLLKNLYRKDKNTYDLRINLKSLKNNINEIGKALEPEQIFKGETLFINGKTSDYIKAEDTNLIHNHFPQAKIEGIENAGHWVHAEQRDAFYEVTKVFLNN